MCSPKNKARKPSPGRTSKTLLQKSLIWRTNNDTATARVRDIVMPMPWAQIRAWLLPGGFTRDEGFHQEILSVSSRGIWVVAAVEALLAIVAFTGEMPSGAAFGLLLLSGATFGAA